jgi:hypothetical protein
VAGEFAEKGELLLRGAAFFEEAPDIALGMQGMGSWTIRKAAEVTLLRAAKTRAREHVAGEIAGRTGKQARLRELGNDPNVSSANRGWIKQEQNAIERGQRDMIRNPPGKDLAHERGREAAKGYSYEHSNLQDRDLHRTEHKFDDFGRANKERPLRPDER